MELEADIIKAQGGEKEAFVRCIQACEASLYRVAKSILKDDADCADAIQETILQAYRKISTLREPKHFKTWLTRIVINESRQIWNRSRKVIPFETIEKTSQNGSFEQVEIRELVDSLEVELRVIVTLYYIEDMSVKQISQILDQPSGTVKSRLARARQKLLEMVNTPRKESVK